MHVARSVERFLEQAVERFSGKVFGGTLEPVALATRLIREADLALRTTSLGPVAPNHFEVGLHPDDLPGDTLPVPVLERAMAASLEEAAAERGWRLAGPMEVRLNHHDTASAGTPDITASSKSGPRPPWGSLMVAGHSHPLSNNRIVIGRSPGADVQLVNDTVSRKHALVWRDEAGIWVRDLDSSNGTTVDGAPATDRTLVEPGAILSFGEVSARLDVITP